MVASSQRLATEAGVDILRQGGNAADATVAVAAALNVTEPTSTGLGGDCFALYFDARTRRIMGLNGSGRAPAALSFERMRADGLEDIPLTHGHAITVPGACAGWCDLAQRHGTLPLSTLFAPAIALAENGFPVAPKTAHFWERGVPNLLKSPGGRALTIDGRAPLAGETFRNPGLARTFRALAAGGKDAYYRGEIGQAVIRAVTAAGGVMTMEDLAAHESTWDEPIFTTYRGLRVWECAPNGQGITALLALNILEGFDLARLDPLGVDRWHLMIEAMRLAFADTRWYVADPRWARVPVAELLSKEYARSRRTLLDPRRAAADVARGSPVAHTDTVYFCVVDGWGNACSFINSNYTGFGTGIVPTTASADGGAGEPWGFTLQNRGLCFSLDPNHPNALAPRKRPYHTIIPGILTREDGSLYAPFGVMGGFMQPQGHVQVVVALVDDAAQPQAALDRPRFCLDPVDHRLEGTGRAHGQADPKVRLEEGLPAATADGLRARGHPVFPGVGGYERALFGRGQIVRDDAPRGLTGGAIRARTVARCKLSDSGIRQLNGSMRLRVAEAAAGDGSPH
jgi:gamma-glutamyltranspeptidase/glutathione hydrolase